MPNLSLLPLLATPLDFFHVYTIPLAHWVATAVNWMETHLRTFFHALEWPVKHLLEAINSGLLHTPEFVVLVVVFLIAWRIASIRVAIFSIASLLLVGFLGIWGLTMTTLAMIVTSVVICVILGVPLGIAAARSDRFESTLRPVLDAMQTTPTFVYLIPVVMLLSIGTVSGVIATIIFAIPPIIRLTNLGIRQVDSEVVEAAFAFGSTPRQVLLEVQLPLALRTIMAGLNQTLMLALSMVVIAAMIGADGLGVPVVTGLNNLEPGIGFVGGLGIVLLAIILDRVTQSIGNAQA